MLTRLANFWNKTWPDPWETIRTVICILAVAFWASRIGKTLLLLAIMTVVVVATAGELTLKNERTGAELRLYDTPCSHGETLAILREEVRARFKNARIRDAKGHIQFYGCWVQPDEESIVVILQDGAAMQFQASAFSDPAI